MVRLISSNFHYQILSSRIVSDFDGDEWRSILDIFTVTFLHVQYFLWSIIVGPILRYRIDDILHSISAKHFTLSSRIRIDFWIDRT